MAARLIYAVALSIAPYAQIQNTTLPPEGKRALQLRRQLDEMERYLRDREDNWKDTHLRASDEPTTRLVLAIEGV